MPWTLKCSHWRVFFTVAEKRQPSATSSDSVLKKKTSEFILEESCLIINSVIINIMRLRVTHPFFAFKCVKFKLAMRVAESRPLLCRFCLTESLGFRDAFPLSESMRTDWAD
jgi:hypothetical protein